MSFTVITVLILCGISWISASVSQSQTVEVNPGEEVTFECDIMNKSGVIFWFRLINRTEVSCISIKIYSGGIKYCNGFQSGRFEMKHGSIVSLKIRSVAKSDAGLYFCGIYTDGMTTFSLIHLNVKGSEPHDDEDSKGESDGIAKLTSVILGALTVVLVLVIIGLVVKVRKLPTAVEGDKKTEQRENLLSDQLKDAALSFYPTPVRSRRPASEREVETRVIYTASR